MCRSVAFQVIENQLNVLKNDVPQTLTYCNTNFVAI